VASTNPVKEAFDQMSSMHYRLNDFMDYSKLKKVILGPGIEAYTFEEEDEEDDETVTWDCDRSYELSDFEDDGEDD
jgi:hypothetical protein